MFFFPRWYKGPGCGTLTCPGKRPSYCKRGSLLDFDTCKCQCKKEETGDDCNQEKCPGKGDDYCLNGGTFDWNTCQCKCVRGIMGDKCEEEICPGKGPNHCGDLELDLTTCECVKPACTTPDREICTRYPLTWCANNEGVRWHCKSFCGLCQ